jgi:hypothetical protein
MNTLKGFTDADFGSSSCYTRKSRTGYIFFPEKPNATFVDGGKEAIHLKKITMGI